jgi:SOS-response transcriptional repressor LexA
MAAFDGGAEFNAERSAHEPGPHSFVWQFSGMSMYAPGEAQALADRDVLYIDPDAQPAPGDLVLVDLGGHQATVRKLIDESAERLLVALNPSWPRRIMPLGQARIRGLVIAKWVAM